MKHTGELVPQAVQLNDIDPTEAAKLAEMLGMALDNKPSTAHIDAYLRRYSVGVGMGRVAGFTAFHLDDELVAMTHTTVAGKNLELDALARLPGMRAQGLGSRALTHTLEAAARDGLMKVGLYTPRRNEGFYMAHGFSRDPELDIEDQPDYLRMQQTL